MAEVRLFPDRLEPYVELAAYERDLISRFGVGQYGATTSFVGSMRDFNEGDEVAKMFLEHYPGMTEKVLEKLCDQAMADYPILDCLILHRVGDILPNDPIVLVAAWSAHRGAAFDAARFLIEKLKTDAPFWKKESISEGERWVEKNTDG
ncbi:molybdenum cofactor biosynthesis protein MoaE [Sulfuriflexus sp.]|uniref:molybdenum cofactor biosynthesis protein MoaE n=1 Tax=Sulfuriflexus sp. TaxID=2015443 RepID=UPI0028CD8CB6|nr:molybdenum cofactor biosynthesis protein MoaE [Sulfuriflexus sp.]MDT8405144.1 molybdenum cofactor biosynthesis protein MoaE [Sulfuriflexus sp.]